MAVKTKNELLEEIEQKNDRGQESDSFMRSLFTERCVHELTKDSSVEALKSWATLF